MKITPEDLKQVVSLSKKSISKLRKMNRELERAYTGKELTKYQLIFQIVFKADSL